MLHASRDWRITDYDARRSRPAAADGLRGPARPGARRRVRGFFPRTGRPHGEDRARAALLVFPLRVDFLTPNRGRESEEPRPLPALGTNAQPLQFLDFLIRDPEPAVVLHGAGILVAVPAPQRFAVHKLIVARQRREGGKQEKDLAQAAALLEVLAARRPYEVRAAWHEARGRGKAWQRLLDEGLSLLPATTADAVRALAADPP
ncbi:MAG: hypothetical protein J0H99_04775 [Rhodospirillales bacterium]|nr:hypothetical protein [Rhodospirillales bacterium]